MSLWRQKIAAKKKKIQDELKKACKEEEVKQELYNKNIKTKTLPDISVESWARFLSLWKSEESNYPTDTGKLAVLKQRLSDTN